MTGCLCESLGTVSCSLNPGKSLSWESALFTSFHLPCKYTCGVLLKQKDSRMGITDSAPKAKGKDSYVCLGKMCSRVKMFTVWSADWPIHPLDHQSWNETWAHSRMEIQAKCTCHYIYTLSRSADFFFVAEFLKEGRVWLGILCRLLSCTVPGHTEFVETAEAMSSVGSCPVSDGIRGPGILVHYSTYCTVL